MRTLCLPLLAFIMVSASVVAGDSTRRTHGRLGREDEAEVPAAKWLPAFIGARPTAPFPGSRPLFGAAANDAVSARNYPAEGPHQQLGRLHLRPPLFQQHEVRERFADPLPLHRGRLYGRPHQDRRRDLSHCGAGKECGATLWLLEHRFYGQSRPFVYDYARVCNDTDHFINNCFRRMYNRNLPYLNSQQAVEDIAAFINAQNTPPATPAPSGWCSARPTAGPWPLWFRTKYPSLTVGAVASSPLVSLEQDNYRELTRPCNHTNSHTNSRVRAEPGRVAHRQLSAATAVAELAARAIRQEIQYVKGRHRLNSELQLQPRLDRT